jgi:K+-sensing histidine kinase KdpD
MLIKNSKSWVSYSLSESIASASLILLIAFLIRLALHQTIEPDAPFHCFILACILIALFYGYKLALVSIFVSTLLGGYFFIKPYNTFGTPESTDWLQFLNFSSVTIFAVLVIEKLQRSLYSQKLLIKVLQSRYRIAILKENDSQYLIQKISKT